MSDKQWRLDSSIWRHGSFLAWITSGISVIDFEVTKKCLVDQKMTMKKGQGPSLSECVFLKSTRPLKRYNLKIIARFTRPTSHKNFQKTYQYYGAVTNYVYVKKLFNTFMGKKNLNYLRISSITIENLFLTVSIFFSLSRKIIELKEWDGTRDFRIMISCG